MRARSLAALLLLALAAGCAPGYGDVRRYGEERFVRELRAVAAGQPPPRELMDAFRPRRAEPHLGGAWLVYRESARWRQGIYVGPGRLDELGGNGVEVTPWSEQVGWVKEKQRQRARN